MTKPYLIISITGHHSVIQPCFTYILLKNNPITFIFRLLIESRQILWPKSSPNGCKSFFKIIKIFWVVHLVYVSLLCQTFQKFHSFTLRPFTGQLRSAENIWKMYPYDGRKRPFTYGLNGTTP